MPTNWNSKYRQQWERRLEDFTPAGNTRSTIKRALYEHRFWIKYLEAMTAEHFTKQCLELESEPDLEPGISPFWCLMLATLEQQNASGDYKKLIDWHWDLKNADAKPDANSSKKVIAPYDLFISYSRSDNSPTNDTVPDFSDRESLWVTRMAELLACDGSTESGTPPVYQGSDHTLAFWLAQENGGGKAQYERMMLPLIAAANHFVLVLSPAYLKCPICLWEMEAILADASANHHKKVIVVERSPVVDKVALLAGTQDAKGYDLPLELWNRHNDWLPFWHYDSVAAKAGRDAFPPLPLDTPAFAKVVPDINRAIKSNAQLVSVYLAETVPELEAERQKLRRKLSPCCNVIPQKNVAPKNYRQNVRNIVTDCRNLIRGVVFARSDRAGTEILLRDQINALCEQNKLWTVWTNGTTSSSVDWPKGLFGEDLVPTDLWEGTDLSAFTQHLIQQMQEPPRVVPLDVVVFHDGDHNDNASELIKFLNDKAKDVIHGNVKTLVPGGDVLEWGERVETTLRRCRRLLGVYVPPSDKAAQEDSLFFLKQQLENLYDRLVDKNWQNQVGMRLCIVPPPVNPSGAVQVNLGRRSLIVLDYSPGWNDQKVIQDTIEALN